MTTFLDGQGKTLMLCAAPVFLRVVVNAAGAWDALDQRTDKPEAGEVCTAYERTITRGMIHINCGRGKSGWYASAEYRVVPAYSQPEQAIMQDNARWESWCAAQ